MKRPFGILMVAAVMVTWGFVNRVCWGDMYKWTDEKGVLHFTDDPSNIPEKFQKNKKQLEEQNYRINNDVDAARSKLGGVKADSIAQRNLLFSDRDRLNREIPEKEKLCRHMRDFPYSLGQYKDCLDSLEQLRSERRNVESEIREWEKIYNKADDVEKTLNATDRPKRR